MKTNEIIINLLKIKYYRKKLSILLFTVPSLYFAQLATPQGNYKQQTNWRQEI